MRDNRTFFKKSSRDELELKDIFSDVLKKHTPEQRASVLIAGTPLTTPREADMLSSWQKPFLFARFFAVCLVMIGLCALMSFWGYGQGDDIMVVVLTIAIPLTLLLLTWEMNIPRDISLSEVIRMMLLGGMLSLITTCVLNAFKIGAAVALEDESIARNAAWAAIVEEPAKLAIVFCTLRKKNYRYILDGVLIGMAVGTGFAVMESYCYVLDEMRTEGIQAAQNLALLRSATLANHGTYAALYGGGLVMAKGASRVRARHLLQIDHLKYFVVSCLLHAAHNSVLYPVVVRALRWDYAWNVIESVLAMLCFLPLLCKGVNQTAKRAAAENGGRITNAVNREPAAAYTPPQAVAPSCCVQLIGQDGLAAGICYTLSEGAHIVIGRNADCAIALPQASNVSGRHCAVSCSGGQLYITDLDSTNGTFVAARRLAPHTAAAVASGELIYLGSRSCAFRYQVL